MKKLLYIPNAVFVFLVICCALISFTANAQQHKAANVIHLKSGDLHIPTANARKWLDSTLQKQPNEPMQVLMHFSELPTASEKETLRQGGITLLDYVPDNTFFAIVQPTADAQRLLSTPLYTIINVRPEWKADNYLWRKVNAEKGAVEVLVSFYSVAGKNEIRGLVAAMGGRINPGGMENYGAYRVVLPADKVRSLAQWHGVRYISPATDMVPLDLQSRPAVKGNIAVASPANGGYGLTGDSVTVGVGDNSSGAYHIDLVERITNFTPVKGANHGQHVNGIVGGAAIIDPLSASMAPRVSLVDFLYDQVLFSVGAMFQDHHMTITNNSYSILAGDCEYSGTYDSYSQYADTLAKAYPDVLNVFASGNDAWMHCEPYPQGYATVAGGYQPAKNNLVVGSITDYLIQAADESHGPVKDGRVKPEIVAIGLGAYSTFIHNGYGWAAGTSMASPQVAGGAALLTQRYKQLTGIQPKADVLKALIVNGAMDIGNPGPDFIYGFGVLDMSRSLHMLDNGHYKTDSLNNGETRIMTINVPANTGQVKVLLSWFDEPASPATSKTLVNDIDLTVMSPSSITHYPLVLDHTPANVGKIATEQADHLNTVEQVVITNPSAGIYGIAVSGYSIPKGPQRFVVAYDIIPKGIQLTYPIGGEQLSNVDSIRVFWNAVPDGNTFTAQFSPNNGGSWLTIDNNIPAGTRYCPFMPLGFNSGECRVRVLNNVTGDIATSEKFTINTQPVARLSNNQCPGYINIHWSPVPNATSYRLLRKIGLGMQVVDTVTDTFYTFKGVPNNIKSYVAVEPVINGLPGYRSIAVSTIANSGNCIGTPSTGDVMVEQIVSPTNGRMFTSTQINPGAIVNVRVRNLYTSPTNNYVLSYKVNAGPWQQLVNPGTIPPNGTATIGIVGIPLSAVGNYTLAVAITNMDVPDPQSVNDTISTVVKNLPNDTLNLTTPFTDGFEAMGKVSVTRDSIGISPNGHWDYLNADDTGRLRSFVSSDITISGSRSISLDEFLAVKNGSGNELIGTFNLSNYDTATAEVRVDFDYMLHGTPKIPDGNFVKARGADTKPWYPLYNYDLGVYPGIVNKAKSLSLTDAVRLAGNNFSSSTQVSFGQNDTSLIALRSYGNGMTIDNVKIYTVQDDAQLLRIVSPLPTNCGLPSNVPLAVQVRNGVNYALHNVFLFYRVDGAGTVFSGSIDSIGAKDTINFTFPQLLNIAPGSTHTLDVWLIKGGDTYTDNDSIWNYSFRNSVIVSNYPYLENFEANDGGYYSDGVNNTWQYGTPAAQQIKKAASGTKAWKTNLTGRYRNLEQSYLYTPCFDLSQLTAPMLSFSSAMDIENCGSVLCDAAYVEYSFDGSVWAKLGATGQGTNWYDPTFNVWNTQGAARWRVTSIPLPQPPTGGSIRLRFVMSTDPGVTLDGVAIDDIHIFDRLHPIFPANGVTTVSHSLSGNQWLDYLSSNQLLASVQPRNQNIGPTEVALYSQKSLSNPTATQYTFPRSYTIKSTLLPTDSTGIRLFLTENDFLSALNDTNCKSCSPVTDAYALGITQYSNPYDTKSENGTLADNVNGVFQYHPYRKVMWVPYGNGYYAQLNVKPLSEFWFNDGGPTGNFAAGQDYLNFVAFRSGGDVKAYWYSLIDTAVDTYTLERSIDGVTFATIMDTQAVHANPGEYMYSDFIGMLSSSVQYYRLRWTMLGKDKIYYSPIRRVDMNDAAENLVQFDARMINSQEVLASWVSNIDGIVNYYILERSIGSDHYTVIDTTISVNRYGQQYFYTDMPGEGIKQGTRIFYKLTAVLKDGGRVVMPERYVDWIRGGEATSIYPNPTFDGNFTINWFADAGATMQLAITNSIGQTVYQASAVATQWDNATTFKNFTGAKGMYFVRMSIEGQQFVAKLVYE
jgi:hypothetical protein